VDTRSLPKLFPLFLKLEDRPALVVGAGKVATEKAEGLKAAGARVTVVAPEASTRVRELAEQGEIAWKARRFRAVDVEGFRVVIASTGNAFVNRAVWRAASRRCIPVNVVDVPDLCDFYYGSIVRREPVMIAISTSGASPALARRLRERLDEVLPERLGELALALARSRARLLASVPGFGARVEAVNRLLDDLELEALDGRTDDEIRKQVDRWIQEVGS
jgi:siroheme synthase-like protein